MCDWAPVAHNYLLMISHCFSVFSASIFSFITWTSLDYLQVELFDHHFFISSLYFFIFWFIIKVFQKKKQIQQNIDIDVDNIDTGGIGSKRT
jgi:phosphotransferase system  glucose/maltose/N-acetylglucosamine-specific IIC component